MSLFLYGFYAIMEAEGTESKKGRPVQYKRKERERTQQCIQIDRFIWDWRTDSV